MSDLHLEIYNLRQKLAIAANLRAQIEVIVDGDVCPCMIQRPEEEWCSLCKVFALLCSSKKEAAAVTSDHITPDTWAWADKAHPHAAAAPPPALAYLILPGRSKDRGEYRKIRSHHEGISYAPVAIIWLREPPPDERGYLVKKLNLHSPKGIEYYGYSQSVGIKDIVHRLRRERNEQALRRQEMEAELLRVTGERDAAIEERNAARDESGRKLGMLRRANSEIERKDAALENAIAILENESEIQGGDDVLNMAKAALSPTEEGKDQAVVKNGPVCGCGCGQLVTGRAANVGDETVWRFDCYTSLSDLDWYCPECGSASSPEEIYTDDGLMLKCGCGFAGYQGEWPGAFPGAGKEGK